MGETGRFKASEVTFRTGSPLKRETVTATVFVAVASLWSSGVLGYVSGLANARNLVIVEMCLLPTLAFMTLFYLTLLLARQRYLSRVGQNRMSAGFSYTIVLILVLVSGVVIHYTVTGPTPKAFVYGFRHRIRWKADIPAIRTWLAEQPPAEGGQVTGLPASVWPRCVELLEPDSVVRYEGFDCLKWVMGAREYGVAIGPDSMKEFPMDAGLDRQLTLGVAAGVYVWYRMQ